MILRKLFLATLAVCCSIGTVRADGEIDHFTHDQVRAALQQGLIRPLSEIMAIVNRDFNAPLLEVEVELNNGRYIYEIVLLARDGSIIELYYDAATTELIGMESRAGSTGVVPPRAVLPTSPWQGGSDSSNEGTTYDGSSGSDCDGDSGGDSD